MGKVEIGIGVAALALTLIALTRKGEAAPMAKYICVYQDGFTADTWAEMAEHYRTVHPSIAVLEFVKIEWE